MRAGRRDQPIRIERLAERPSDFVADEGQWSTVHSGWAWVRPLTGRELENGRQITATVSHRLELDFAGVDIKPGDRAVHYTTGAIYNIDAVINPDSANVTLELYATESVQ